MTELHFRAFIGEKSLLGVVDLPVEVRKPNLSLVAQTVTSQRLPVGPGTYLVSARLPSGEQLYNTITVGEGEQDLDVELRPDPDEEIPISSAPISGFENLSFGLDEALTRDLEDRKLQEPRTAESQPVLRVFRGNLLQGPLTAQASADLIEPSTKPPLGEANFEVHAEPPALIQLLMAGTPPLNIMLPARDGERCLLTIRHRPDGSVNAELELHNLTANALLGFTTRGQFTQATALTSADSPELISQDLLYGKFRDAIAACVGAYTLLRQGEIKRLHNWTANLKEYMPWLPDGVTILAEHLARMGKHDEALQVLLELPDRGLPFFSDGLSYAVKRLRTYLEQGRSDVSFRVAPEAAVLLDNLRRFVPFTDFRRPILTFTGLDPAAPDETPLGDDLSTLEGLRTGPYFGHA